MTTTMSREDVLSALREKVTELAGDGAVHVIDEGPVVLILTGHEDDTTLREIRHQVQELAAYWQRRASMMAEMRFDLAKGGGVVLVEGADGRLLAETADERPRRLDRETADRVLSGLEDDGYDVTARD